jgi:hypothetical protein
VALVLFSDGSVSLFGFHAKTKRDLLLPLKLTFKAEQFAVLPQVLHEGIGEGLALAFLRSDPDLDGLLAVVSGGHSIFLTTLTKLLDRFYEWEDSNQQAASEEALSLLISKVLLTSQPVKQVIALRMDCIATVSTSSESTIHVVNTQ